MSFSYRKYEDIITIATKSAILAAISETKVPRFDVDAMSTIWIGMIMQISKRSGSQISKQTSAKFVALIGSGIVAYWGNSALFTKLLGFIPGSGTLAFISINSFVNALFTYRLGKNIACHLESSGFSTEEFLNVTIAITPILLSLPNPNEIKEIFGNLSS